MSLFTLVTSGTVNVNTLNLATSQIFDFWIGHYPTSLTKCDCDDLIDVTDSVGCWCRCYYPGSFL